MAIEQMIEDLQDEPREHDPAVERELNAADRKIDEETEERMHARLMAATLGAMYKGKATNEPEVTSRAPPLASVDAKPDGPPGAGNGAHFWAADLRLFLDWVDVMADLRDPADRAAIDALNRLLLRLR